MRIACSILSIAVLMIAQAPALAADSAETAAAPEKSACLDRKPLTLDEHGRVLMLNAYFSHLNAVRPRAMGDSDQAYQAALSQILKLTHPGSKPADIVLDTPRLIEKGLEFLIWDDFKNLVSRSIGLDRPEFAAFDSAFKPILLENDGTVSGVVYKPLEQAGQSLRLAIRAYYKDQMSGISARIESLKGRWNGDVAVLDLQMARFAELERYRLETLLALDRLLETGSHLATQNGERLDDRVYMQSKIFQGTLGLGVLLGSAWVAVPMASAATTSVTLVTAASAVGSGCVIGALGGGAEAIFEDAVESFGQAYLRSETFGTPIACELREQYRREGAAAMDKLAVGVKYGVATGCTLVGASLVAPKVVGKVLIDGAGAITAAQAAYAGRAGYRAWKAWKKANASGEPTAPAPVEVEPLDQLVAQSQGRPGQSAAVSAYLRYVEVREFYLAEQRARQSDFAGARAHILEAHRLSIEAGDAVIGTIMAGILVKDLKSDLVPVLHEAEEEIVEAVSSTSSHVGGVLRASLGLLLPEKSSQSK